jgi:hypothetical protein
MAHSARSLLQAAWSKVTNKPAEPATPPVMVYDPAAQGAQDLDDPFLDPKARERAGELIARVAQGGKDRNS